AWHETTTSGTECTRRHASGTAEQCAQHGSQGVEGGFTEEGSTAQAGQRKEAGHEETRFLTPRNLSRPDLRLQRRRALFPVVEVGGHDSSSGWVFWRKES